MKKVKINVVVSYYEAFDGKQFKHREKCIKYEKDELKKNDAEYSSLSDQVLALLEKRCELLEMATKVLYKINDTKDKVYKNREKSKLISNSIKNNEKYL